MRRSVNAARAARKRAERVEPDEAEMRVNWRCGMKYLIEGELRELATLMHLPVHDDAKDVVGIGRCRRLTW